MVDEGEETDEARARRVSLALVPAVLLAGVAGGIAFPILPIAGARAGLSLPFIGLILAANRASRILANPIVGYVSDRFGGRRMLLTGMVIQIVVMLLYAAGIETGHPGGFFLGGRILHGPGTAGIFVAAQALALQSAGKGNSGRATGTVRAAIGIGVPLGLVIGGFLSDLIGEARAFEASAIVLVLATVVAFAMVPDIRVPVGPTRSMRESLKMLADKRLLAICGLSFAQTFSASGMVLTTMVLLVADRHLKLFGLADKSTAGAMMGLMVIVEGLSMPAFGALGDRRSAHAQVAIAGISTLCLSLVGVAFSFHVITLAASLVLLGLGAGALGPSLLAILGSFVPPERRGTVLGALSLTSDIGGALGPIVGTSLFAGDIRVPYLVSAALLLAFLPLSFTLRPKQLEEAT